MEYYGCGWRNPVVVDVPSGGGLHRTFSSDRGASLNCGRSGGLRFCRRGAHPGAREVFLRPADDPNSDGRWSADLVISMAGLHHLSDSSFGFSGVGAAPPAGGRFWQIRGRLQKLATARFLDLRWSTPTIQWGTVGTIFDETILKVR